MKLQKLLPTNLNKELLEAYGVQPVDHREFEAKLKLKANTKETERLEAEKANTLEQQQLILMTDSLQKQIDQFLLVLIDYYRNITVDTGNSSQKEIKRASTIIDQLHAMYKWNSNSYDMKYSKFLTTNRKNSVHAPKLKNQALALATIDYSTSLK